MSCNFKVLKKGLLFSIITYTINKITPIRMQPENWLNHGMQVGFLSLYSVNCQQTKNIMLYILVLILCCIYYYIEHLKFYLVYIFVWTIHFIHLLLQSSDDSYVNCFVLKSSFS